MLKDQHGNAVSGATAEAVALLDTAIHQFNIYRGDPTAPLDQATLIAPEFAMAYIAKAHMLVTTSEPGALNQARELIDTARALRTNERERSHIAALTHVFDGEWSRAALALDQHNARYPRDLLALQCGHLLDFFRGNARNLRDRIARVLPNWSQDIPGYSILLGLHAFGLEECGNYEQAEEQGRQAVALQPLDCWAHHAVTHVMEMQGRPEDGLGWMIAREPYWAGDDNGFKIHNWWHRALFHLDVGQKVEALALYDGTLREDRSELVLDLVDASSLLWRLALAGVDLGDRWVEVADCWQQHADGKTYPFNDWHAVMAWLGAERRSDIEVLTGSLQQTAGKNTETGRWVRETGLPLIEGFTAFWQGDYQKATEQLYGARYIANAFGGSHAQRDVIDWTLTEAAIRAGANDLAMALINERVALKPRSAINQEFLSSVRQATTAMPKAATV